MYKNRWTTGARVSSIKNDEFSIINDESSIKNAEFCIKYDGSGPTEEHYIELLQVRMMDLVFK